MPASASSSSSSDPLPTLTSDHPSRTIARGEKRPAASMFWTLGCIYGATAVTFGAFGAHGLKKRIADPAKIANWATAAHYQLIHSAVLLTATSVLPTSTLAPSLLVAGMTMFSGSIYLLVLDPARFKFLGPVTPLGGLCLIGGWVALGVGARKGL